MYCLYHLDFTQSIAVTVYPIAVYSSRHYNTVAIYRFCRRDRHLSLPSYFSFAFCRCRHLFIKIVATYRCRLLILSPCHLSLSPYFTVAIYCCRLFPLSPSVAVVIDRTSSISVFCCRLISSSPFIVVAIYCCCLISIVVAIYRFRRLSLPPFITVTLCRYLLDRILLL